MKRIWFGSIAFFLTWSGLPGKGRALGAKDVKFSGMVLPTVKTVRYEIDMRRMMRQINSAGGLQEFGQKVLGGKQ